MKIGIEIVILSGIFCSLISVAVIIIMAITVKGYRRLRAEQKKRDTEYRNKWSEIEMLIDKSNLNTETLSKQLIQLTKILKNG